MSNAPIDLQFSSAQFTQVEEGFGLFNSAAKQLLKKISGSEKVTHSIKYQVLCDETAFVGVVKQRDKASGELLDFSIEFG